MGYVGYSLQLLTCCICLITVKRLGARLATLRLFKPHFFYPSVTITCSEVTYGMYNVALSPLPLSRSFISLITIVEFIGAVARRSAVSCESVASENNPSVQPLAFCSGRMLSGMLAHGSTPLCRYANHERGSIACLLRQYM